MSNAASSPEEALTNMLNVLRGFLPPPSPPLPDPSVSVTSVTELPLALGNRRGTERRSSFGVVALTGGRLDAVARFQLWADNPSDADSRMDALHSELLAARDKLWPVGFLRLKAQGSAPGEYVADINAWRKSADYQILYEFHSQNSEGAESLIAQIPVHSDPEELDSLLRETFIITDEMIRWDNEAALTLEVCGGTGPVSQVRELVIVAFLPVGWDGDNVTVSAVINGTTRQRVFPSVRAFLGTFTLDPGNITLGANPYMTGRWAFPNADFPEPILLTGRSHVFRVQYAAPAFDSDAVLYVRVL